MDKSEYITKREELYKQLIDLKQEYIKTNSPIPSGTKVKITNGCNEVRYGFLVGYTCNYDDVEPIVRKMNKDGKPHATINLYVSKYSKVEIA